LSFARKTEGLQKYSQCVKEGKVLEFQLIDEGVHNSDIFLVAAETQIINLALTNNITVRNSPFTEIFADHRLVQAIGGK
jgi:hypothetical protein